MCYLLCSLILIYVLQGTHPSLKLYDLVTQLSLAPPQNVTSRIPRCRATPNTSRCSPNFVELLLVSSYFSIQLLYYKLITSSFFKHASPIISVTLFFNVFFFLFSLHLCPILLILMQKDLFLNSPYKLWASVIFLIQSLKPFFMWYYLFPPLRVPHVP